jgi:predicted nuclease of predicted toxin-antitoxin system
VSLALYMDVHVPLAITRGLRRRGVDVLTAQQDGAAELPDERLLDRAAELGRILFSRDQDLLVEAARRMRSGKAFAAVVFARQADVSISRCVADLELLAKSATPEDAVGQVVYLPL